MTWMIIGIVSIIAAAWGVWIAVKAMIDDWRDRRRYPPL